MKILEQDIQYLSTFGLYTIEEPDLSSLKEDIQRQTLMSGSIDLEQQIYQEQARFRAYQLFNLSRESWFIENYAAKQAQLEMYTKLHEELLKR